MESVIMPLLSADICVTGVYELPRPLGGRRVRWRASYGARNFARSSVARILFVASFRSEKIACVVWTCVGLLKELVFSAVSAASSHSGQSERFTCLLLSSPSAIHVAFGLELCPALAPSSVCLSR